MAKSKIAEPTLSQAQAGLTVSERLTASQYHKAVATPRKKRKKPRTLEEKLHIEVRRFLDAALTDDTIYLHPPNNPRSKVAGAKLKAMGMKAGAPDLLFCDKGRFLAIELKKPRGPKGEAQGYLSPAQKAWREKFERAGGTFSLCRTIDEVRHTLTDWGVETKVK